jgi:protoporphyrinogen/coproporphyrinogen III oxidase
MKRIAVIGAGAAGLAAAVDLSQGGASVTLYDRSDRAGGLLRTEHLAGAHVDVGVQLVSSSYDELFALASRCGARDLLRRAPGRDALWRKGRAHAITYGSVASMATSSALPTTLKLKMAGKYLPFLTAQARRLDANDPAGTGGVAHDRESIGAWGARELGRDFVELLVYPVLGAYYGAAPERTSAAMYHALARVAMDVSVYAAASGFGALADALLRAVESRGNRFHGGTEVTAVRAERDGVTIVTSSGEDSYDSAVVAVPAPRAAALLDSEELAVWLSQVRVQPTFTAAYIMDRPFPGDYFGLSFPRGESPGDRVVALCIQRNKSGALVPEGGDALVALPAPAAVDGLMGMNDEELAGMMLESLESAVPGIARRVTATHVHRFADGYALFTPGSLQHLQRFDPAWLPPNIALAGQYLQSPTVEGAVRSGLRAARRVS